VATNDWSRIANSTIKNYIREREVNTLRNRKLTALLKKKGRYSFGWSGTKMDWKVKFKRVKPVPSADGDILVFDRKDRHKTAELDWRGYAATDSMTKGEFLKNRNKEAIIRIYSTIAEDLMDDLEDQFGEEFYVNGYLPQNAKRLHGLDSFMSWQYWANTYPGSTVVAWNGAVQPQSVYAGLSCVPGYYGGTWNSGTLPDWPNGKGDTQYDFWSPIIVDYTDGLFGGGTTPAYTGTWEQNCVDAISFGFIKAKKSKSAKGQLDVVFMDDEMYRLYLKALRTKERIIVERTANESPLIAMGFSDVVNQDGVDLTFEYGMPPDSAYGFNCDMMELRSQQAQVFVPEGPDFDIASRSWRFSVDFYGNVVFNPKFQVKWVDGSTRGLSLTG
jgi:hypothetical protein